MAFVPIVDILSDVWSGASPATTGTLRVSGSVSIPGTVSVTQDTSPWVVSGTVAATQSGTWNIGTLTSITNAVTVTQATAANLNATVVGTGTFAVQAAQSGTWNINNISGTISLPTGAATESTLSTLNGKIPSGLTVTSTRLLVDGSGVTQPVSGSVTANAGTNLNTSALNLETTQTAFSARFTSSSSAITSVAGSASSVTLLASNSSRKGASIYNDSTAILYVKCGATASTSSFTTKVYPEEFFILNNDPVYTGVIDGIWASATGNARITELT